MLQQFEANTLEEAYERASKQFSCSIVDLKIDIIQYPSKGLFGLFSKQAIIKAKVIKKNQNTDQEKFIKKRKHITIESFDNAKKIKSKEKCENYPKPLENEKIFDDFYDKQEDISTSELVIKKDYNDLIKDIKNKVNELFSYLCYDIDEIKVDIIEDDIVYIEFSGKDSALLIGKEGYRYKALSYLLFNWINEKYGMMLRLEVAQFLANQEEAMNNYLVPVIETIKTDGFYKTKVLDGILVHIALKRLREEFPNKYVAIKINHNNEKYILVNEYKK